MRHTSLILTGVMFTGLLLTAPQNVAVLAQPQHEIAESSQPFDILIVGAEILDGSGGEAVRSDVGIRDGRIAAIGDLGSLNGAKALRTIHAAGMIVAPGFIDIHTHVEYSLPNQPLAPNLIRDGVTTVITGNCGGSAVDVGSWLTELEEKGISLNLGSFVGHNTVRRTVMKSANRAPTERELKRMVAIVDRAMRAGAFGFSTGLQYVPGAFSETGEVVALARAAARHGGLYSTHIRNEEEKVVEAIEEAISIARATGMPLEISHFKVANRHLWGASDKTLGMIEQARAEGVDVTVDVYPYAASSTTLDFLVPPHAMAGGRAAFRQRMKNPETRNAVAAEMFRNHREVGGWQHLDWPVVSNCPWDAALNGKSIRDINLEQDRPDTLESEIETVLDMVARDHVQMVFHDMSEVDVERILAHPLSMVARDSGIHTPNAGTRPHPRGYGAAARVLGHYVREKGVLSLAEAVRKLTGAPAARMGLRDRGMIKEGYWADIVIFDPDTIIDAATFDDPHQYSKGIEYVLVNGQPAVENNHHTQARPGQVLRKNSTRRRD